MFEVLLNILNILETNLCRVGATNTGPKECLKALVKRLNHPDPHVVVQVFYCSGCYCFCYLFDHPGP